MGRQLECWLQTAATTATAMCLARLRGQIAFGATPSFVAWGSRCSLLCLPSSVLCSRAACFIPMDACSVHSLALSGAEKEACWCMCVIVQVRERRACPTGHARNLG